MKEQRAKQTAHLILVEALGLELADPTWQNVAKAIGFKLENTSQPTDEEIGQLESEVRRRDLHGVYLPRAGRAPVDFVVIEDLSRYRTSQGRTRRENGTLMKWCHREIRNKLHEMCEDIFGIRIVETPPAFSSLFCSCSGAAGFRAVEVHPESASEPRWRKLLEEPKAEPSSKPRRKRRQSTYNVEAERKWAKMLFEKLVEINKGRDGRTRKQKYRTLLAPETGGTIFVPIGDLSLPDHLHTRQQQSDLNAAVNLGLRVVGSPLVWAIHPRFRTEGTIDEKTSERVLVASERRKAHLLGEKKFSARLPLDQAIEHWGKTKNPMFFADLAGFVEDKWLGISLPTGELPSPRLISARALWKEKEKLQWYRVSKLNNDRLKEWGFGRPLPEQEDDLP